MELKVNNTTIKYKINVITIVFKVIKKKKKSLRQWCT